MNTAKKTVIETRNGSRNGNGHSRLRPSRGDAPTHEEFMREILATLDAIDDGDFTARMPAHWPGLEGKVADSLNSMSARLERFNKSLVNLRREVGQEGRVNSRLAMGDNIGSWAERVEAVNALVDELSQPTIEVGR